MSDDLVLWFNSQPAWMREAVETYVKNGKIEDTKIAELADICISEAKGDDCSKYKVSAINLLSAGQGDSFAIKSISNIRGVNAIDTDKPMIFAENGMNVIYGANGAGKSGYIRIFKMISGATYREEIKNNIYKSKKIKPECVITVMDDDKKQQDFQCDLQKPGEFDILKKIDIFDTKTALGYVNEEKEAAFEPWIFGLFSTLGEVATKVKEEIINRMNKIHMDSYDIPHLISETNIVKNLEKITFESKPEDFIKDFSHNDEQRLMELKAKSQIEKNELDIKLKNGQINSLTEILDYFMKFREFYTETNFKDLAVLSRNWELKLEAYKLSQELLDKNIDDVDKRGQTSAAWKDLWRLARQLFETVKTDEDKEFTIEGGVCPLCHHKITGEESVRMKTIDEYVNGKASVSKQQAKAKYKQALNYHLQTKTTEEIMSKIGDFKDEFEELIKRVNDVLIKNKIQIDKCVDAPISLLFIDMGEIINNLNKKIEELKSNVDELRKINEVEDQKRIGEEIANLEAQKAIKENENAIRNNIIKIKKKHLYEEAVKKTATNKLTSKSKALAKELITDAYIDRFNDELKKLSASGLTACIVQGRGKAGKNPYKVQLCDVTGEFVSPKDILSEGESRAVALAAFFAEAAGRTETCPLIIDDPISSLDYEYEKRVINRLVEASLKRQVIVFTHRISVVVGISEEITDRELFHELSLKATKDRKGIPGEPDVNASKSDKILNKLIHDNLSKIKKMDELSEEYLKEKHYICQQFRNCVEKSVEEYLIGEVVMRFRKDVQTKRIKYLSTITQDDCKEVDVMMTKYSAYDHSMSAEAPLIEFEISEIEEDMNDFSKWLSKRKSRIK